MDGGEEPIADRGLVDRLRARGRRVHVEALLTAFALTGLGLGIPQ